MSERRARQFGAAGALLLQQRAKHGKPLVVVGALGLVDCKANEMRIDADIDAGNSED